MWERWKSERGGDVIPPEVTFGAKQNCRNAALLRGVLGVFFYFANYCHERKMTWLRK